MCFLLCLFYPFCLTLYFYFIFLCFISLSLSFYIFLIFLFPKSRFHHWLRVYYLIFLFQNKYYILKKLYQNKCCIWFFNVTLIILSTNIFNKCQFIFKFNINLFNNINFIKLLVFYLFIISILLVCLKYPNTETQQVIYGIKAYVNHKVLINCK